MSHYQIASHSRLAKFWFDQIGSSSRLHFFARLGEIPDWPDWTQILIGQIAWESRLDIVGRFFDFQIAFISRLAHFSRLVPNPDWHDIAQQGRQGRQRRQGHHARGARDAGTPGTPGTLGTPRTPGTPGISMGLVLVPFGSLPFPLLLRRGANGTEGLCRRTAIV